ncbi:DNA helicase-primase complex component [Cercopithecine alphaherpesvirus 9]|uniref:DNA helicase-primase complex component n=1 Tax=Cercopithecine herpesvirus 9 (strain DHV) TaxID=36348 RepID=Q9E1W8_CHV9D|nr:helicase-primase subunit [Cercopithecine alphaherpesvirus 9]AAG27227.1 DNA helicase-primase complex component [Cercopithecine alphaherpesvirus 9]
MNETNCSKATVEYGCICAASIYSAWTQPGNTSNEYPYVLCYLLCKDVDGTYSPRFSEITISAEDLCRYSKHPGIPTPATAASACRLASSAAFDAWPLEPMGNCDMWRCIYGSTIATLRRTLGFSSYYSPVVFQTDTKTGLLIKALPMNPCTSVCVPSTGVLQASADVYIEQSAINACHIQHHGCCLAYARLAALKNQSSESTPTSLNLTLSTSTAHIQRRYTSVFSKPVERDGDVSSIFNLVEKQITVSGTRNVYVRVLLPQHFDCLATDPNVTTALSVLTVYRMWYAAAFGKPGALRQIYAYLGPELYPRGENHNYFCTVGFPGWTTLRTATPTAESVRAAVETYAETDGLWPVTGITAFHYLAPWTIHPPLPAHFIKTHLNETSTETKQWPAGRISSIVECPVEFHDQWLAKFDFSVFFPTIYCAFFPTHNRLLNIIVARRRRGLSCLKAALVTFFGGLRYINPTVYKAIIYVVNCISVCVHKIAAEHKFVICTYVKDGFWGTFINLKVDVISYDEARAHALRLSNACETSVAKYLRDELRLQLLSEIEPLLRIEGVFTHCLIWCTTGTWFWNIHTRASSELTGVPTYSTAAKDIKEGLGQVLCKAVDIRTELYASTWTVSNYITWTQLLTQNATDFCISLLDKAFHNQHNHSYWSTPDGALNHATGIVTDLQHYLMLDKDCKHRQMVFVRTHGIPRAIPKPYIGNCCLPPYCLPPIDVITHLRPLLQTFSNVINYMLHANNDFDVETPKFLFDIEKYYFLFM